MMIRHSRAMAKACIIEEHILVLDYVQVNDVLVRVAQLVTT